MIKIKLSCSGISMSSENYCRNQTYESLFSCSTIASAIRKMLLFPSLVEVDSICPPNLPFRWHPFNLRIGLKPPKKINFLYIISYIHSLKFGLCIFIFHFSLQSNLTSYIIQPHHLSIIPKLPILQLFIPSNQISSFPFSLYT